MSDNIRVSKIGSDFKIYKNDNFKMMIDVCKYTYEKMILDLEKETKIKYIENVEFSTLMANIVSDKKTSNLNLESMMILQKWIDLICQLMLDKTSTDLKNKKLNRFFKISSNFNKKISKLLAKEEVV